MDEPIELQIQLAPTQTSPKSVFPDGNESEFYMQTLVSMLETH